MTPLSVLRRYNIFADWRQRFTTVNIVAIFRVNTEPNNRKRLNCEIDRSFWRQLEWQEGCVSGGVRAALPERLSAAFHALNLAGPPSRRACLAPPRPNTERK